MKFRYKKANRLQWLYLTMTVFAISGCSLLGPDYVKPNINTPSDWSSANSNTNESGISDTAWWHQFNDPVLNDMIHQALMNNNNIQVAIGNIMQAKAQLQKAQMAWVPTIYMGGGGFVGQSFNQTTTMQNPALATVPTTSNMSFDGAFGGFAPIYSLNIFSLIKNQDVADLNVKMQQASKNAVRLAVISQVAGGYFNLLGLQKQLELQEQMIEDVAETRNYIKVQIKNGTATDMELREIDQMLEAISAQVPSINDNIVQTQNALQVLMNKNPSLIMTGNDIDNIKTDGVIPVNLPSAVLKNRPDIIAAEYGVEVSNAKIGVAMSQFFPMISLTSPVGAASFQLSNLFTGSLDFWMAQIMANMPLLNLGIYADINQAKASYYAAYYNYIQTVRNAFAQVDNGLSKHQSADNTFKQQQKALSAAEDLYKLSQIQYKNGSSSYSSTLNFKLNIDYSELNSNQAKMNQLNSIVNLYQALGGGYNVENTESAVKFNDSHDI